MNMAKDHGERADYGNWVFALAEFTLAPHWAITCLLYTSDAADERSSVDLGGRRIIKKKNALHSVTCRHHTEQDSYALQVNTLTDEE